MNDVKKVFEEAANDLRLTGGKTIIFMDEIHRFTKAQQDIFLPYVERGTITLYSPFCTEELIVELGQQRKIQALKLPAHCCRDVECSCCHL